MKNVAILSLLLVSILPLGVLAYGVTDISNPILTETPAWFEGDGAGGFYGETESGLPFTQQAIVNDYSVKIHRFTINNDFFYITDRGTIEASDDLTAISIYLSEV